MEEKTRRSSRVRASRKFFSFEEAEAPPAQVTKVEMVCRILQTKRKASKTPKPESKAAVKNAPTHREVAAPAPAAKSKRVKKDTTKTQATPSTDDSTVAKQPATARPKKAKTAEPQVPAAVAEQMHGALLCLGLLLACDIGCVRRLFSWAISDHLHCWLADDKTIASIELRCQSVLY